MSITVKQVYASAPATERGRATFLSVDEKTKNKLLYTNGNCVYMRNVKDPLNVEIYQEHQYNVTAARFAPSGNYVCSGDETGNVRIWATDNKDKTLKTEIKPLAKTVRDIAWTPDSQRVVVVGEGKGLFGYVFLFDSGSSVGEISGHSQSILSVDMKPTRPFRIATGGEDACVNFFQGPPFKFAHSVKEHTRYVNCVRFSPDGNFFVTASSDKTAILFDGKEGKKIGSLDTQGGHTMSIYGVCFSPDSKQLVTASADKSIKIWDVETRKLVKSYKFQDANDFMQMGVVWATPDTIISLSLNGDLNYFDPNSFEAPKKIVEGHNKKIYQVLYDSKTNKLYTSGAEGTLIRWDYGVGSAGRAIGSEKYTSAISTLAHSEDFLVAGSVDQMVRFVNIANGAFEYTSAELKLDGVPNDICVSKTDTSLVVISTQKNIALIKGQQVKKVWATPFEPTSVMLSPNGSELAVGGADKKVHIYQFNENDSALQEKCVLEAHRGRITKVRYSPNGGLLASGDTNREIIVWDVEAKKEKYSGLVFHATQITDLDWSADSKYLVSGSVDKNIIVWDLENGKRAIAENVNLQGTTNVCFINENTVLSTGNDNTMKTFQFSF